MDSIEDVAGYMVKRNPELTGKPLKKERLYLLLYLAQRYSFAACGEKLFAEPLSIVNGKIFSSEAETKCFSKEFSKKMFRLSEKAKYVASNVIFKNREKSLEQIEKEISGSVTWNNYKKSRNAARYVIPLKDIQEHSKTVRKYDSVWGMYDDEFEKASMPD